MKVTIKKDSEAAKAFESLREDKQEFKESVQSGETLSDKYQQYKDWLNEIPEISDEEIGQAGQKWCHAVGEDGFVNSGDDYDIHELPAFIAGAKWYREQLKQRQNGNK